MLSYAAIFLVMAIITAAFAFGGVVSLVAAVAKGMFFLFLVLFLGTLVIGLTRNRKLKK
jgi:uncharacterized membrane protein YtjA (UPF0391 family)